MVTKDSQPSKAERRDVARTQALKLQQEQLRQEKRSRAIIIGSLVVGLAIVGVIIFAILRSAPEDLVGISEIPESVEAPAVADPAGGVTFGATGEAGSTSGDDAVTVSVYLDYMCPNCAQFEALLGPELDDLRAAGDITLVLHPVSILDGASQGTQYSTRAAAAFAYVAENDPEHALAFNTAMFVNQPREGTEGLTDEQIQGIAVEAGVTDTVAAAIADQKYMEFVKALTQVAYGDPAVVNADGGFGTPTVVINGERFNGNWSQPGAVATAIEAAKGADAVQP